MSPHSRRRSQVSLFASLLLIGIAIGATGCLAPVWYPRSYGYGGCRSGCGSSGYGYGYGYGGYGYARPYNTYYDNRYYRYGYPRHRDHDDDDDHRHGGWSGNRDRDDDHRDRDRDRAQRGGDRGPRDAQRAEPRRGQRERDRQAAAQEEPEVVYEVAPQRPPYTPRKTGAQRR